MQTTPTKCVSARKAGVPFQVFCVAALLILLCSAPLAAQLDIMTPQTVTDMMEGKTTSANYTAKYLGDFHSYEKLYNWPVNWSAAGLPAGDNTFAISITSVWYGTGTLTVTPDIGTGGQTYTVTINAFGNVVPPGSTSVDTDSVTVAFTVYKPVTLSASGSLGGLRQGRAFSYVVTADEGYGKVSFSSPDLPSWLSLDPNTGELQGTPSVTDVGSHTFTVRAADEWAGDRLNPSGPTEDEATFTIDVSDMAVFTDALPNARVGEDYRFALLGDGAGDLIWTVSGLPGGLSIDADGVISGAPVPGTEGVYAISIQLMDSASLSDSVSVITRVALVVNGEFSDDLTVTTVFPPVLRAGEAMPPIRLAALGGTGNYTWIIQGLPAGLRFVDGEIVGAPESNVEGAYPLKLIVNDGVSSTSTIVTLQVSSSTDSPEQDGVSLAPAPNPMPNLAGAAAGCTLAPGATSSAIKGQIVMSLLLFALSIVTLRRRFSDLRA